MADSTGILLLLQELPLKKLILHVDVKIYLWPFEMCGCGGPTKSKAAILNEAGVPWAEYLTWFLTRLSFMLICTCIFVNFFFKVQFNPQCPLKALFLCVHARATELYDNGSSICHCGVSRLSWSANMNY